MPKAHLITAKKTHINDQIAQLQRNAKVVNRVGGRTAVTLGEEIKFQQDRLKELTWAQDASDEDIQARIDDYEGQMVGGPYEYGNVIMTGLPQDEIELVAKVELLMIAFGTHPGVK